jgi:hypothetical protein
MVPLSFADTVTNQIGLSSVQKVDPLAKAEIEDPDGCTRSELLAIPLLLIDFIPYVVSPLNDKKSF